jgi:SAM-dependent methyltransferase
MMDERAAWDRFWSYDRLSSFGTGKGSGNYDEPIAAGWRSFFAALPPRARVLDIATGNGAIAVIAVEAGEQLKVTGADLAAVRPADFVSKNKGALGKIRFVGGAPAEKMPFDGGSFDAVVSQYGIEYSDLKRSLPEAVRALAAGGRLRFACHAAEGEVAANTKPAIADADFLLDEVDITGRAARCFEAVLGVERGHQAGQLAEMGAQARYAQFREGLKAIAERASAAADQAMLVSVHQALTALFERRHDLGLQTLFEQLDALRAEVDAHRTRERALLAAARSAKQMEALGRQLAKLGMTDVAHGEQRNGTALIGHVIEATKP